MCCFLCFLNACFRFHNRWQSLSDTSWAHQVCRVGNRKATTKMSFAKHHGSYLSHTKLWNAFPLSPTHIVYTHLYSSPHTWLYSSFPASAGSLSLTLMERTNRTSATVWLNSNTQSGVNQLFTGSVQKLCCVEVSAHLSCGWTLPVVLSLVCFPTAPTTTGGKTPPGREASCRSSEMSRSPERKWDQETKKERTTSLFHFHPLLLLLLLLAPPPLSSSPLPSSPGWACQPLERQSDMPSAAVYQGLIKGGWQCRIEPNQGGSWTRADCASSLSNASDWKWSHS